ncbi:hypothetical protein GCM10018777_35580 [Streptomyces albogriseolus]|nr:hypothetical protein GCM10018777_35580 [Streptomyces viridodiastaticus]
MSLGIGAVMSPAWDGGRGAAMWRGPVGLSVHQITRLPAYLPTHLPADPSPSPLLPPQRPTNVSSVASGGHANRTGV